jgi:hypothetical protein
MVDAYKTWWEDGRSYLCGLRPLYSPAFNHAIIWSGAR